MARQYLFRNKHECLIRMVLSSVKIRFAKNTVGVSCRRSYFVFGLVVRLVHGLSFYIV